MSCLCNPFPCELCLYTYPPEWRNLLQLCLFTSSLYLYYIPAAYTHTHTHTHHTNGGSRGCTHVDATYIHSLSHTHTHTHTHASLMNSTLSGKFLECSMKEVTKNTLVAVEIACWFYVGEMIGRKSIIGYKV